MTIRNRYPDSDILAQRGHWDAATRRVVLDRVHNTPAFRFFNGHEQATLEALCALVVPQQHRPADRRVPLAAWIDAHCMSGHTDGFRLDDMPPNPDAWRLGIHGVDESSQLLFGNAFACLNITQQREVVEHVRAGDPPGELWQNLPAKRWWIFVALRQITGVYYAHPYAWDEIGFGGPAYPRGYFALNHGYPEPWEARER
jgi:gluconate 2-dehydrogenase subunit 3-like protein